MRVEISCPVPAAGTKTTVTGGLLSAIMNWANLNLQVTGVTSQALRTHRRVAQTVLINQ